MRHNDAPTPSTSSTQPTQAIATRGPRPSSGTLRSDREGSASWQAFVRAHALVVRRIEADLMAAHQLSLVSFDVLERLGDAPRRRLRMAELADLLVVSRSGVTRAVDRLARQGLVNREPCDSDLRGTYAVLTPAGAQKLSSAEPTHDAGVRFYLLDPLAEAHRPALARILDPVLTRLEHA